MRPNRRFTGTIWIFLSLLDAGHHESMETVASHIEDGSLFEYLGQKYDTDTTMLAPEDRAAVITAFRAAFTHRFASLSRGRWPNSGGVSWQPPLTFRPRHGR